MDSGRYNNIPFVNFLKRMILSNRENVNSISSSSLAKQLPLTNIPRKDISFDLLDVGLQISVREGIVIGKVHVVIRVQKGVLPGQREKRLILSRTFGVAVLVVLDALPTPVPAQIFLLRLLLTIDDDLHPSVVQAVMLIQIQYIKPHLLVLHSVRHLEEKPLRIPVRVYVILEQ